MVVDGKEEEADSEVDGEGLLLVVSFSLPFFFGIIVGSLVECSMVSTVSVRSIHRVKFVHYHRRGRGRLGLSVICSVGNVAQESMKMKRMISRRS